MSLLRFGASLDARTIARAIRESFEGFAEAGDLQMSLYGTEWIATSRKYGFEVHTWKHTHEIEEEKIREQEAIKLRFQASMFLDTLDEGSRILIRRDPLVEGHADESAIRELHAAIRERGACPLVWISSKSEHPNGAPTIDRLAPGLFQAANPGLAPRAWVSDYDVPSWLSLLERIDQLVRSEAAWPTAASSPEVPQVASANVQMRIQPIEVPSMASRFPFKGRFPFSREARRESADLRSER